jgi:hypothetical protein
MKKRFDGVELTRRQVVAGLSSELSSARAERSLQISAFGCRSTRGSSVLDRYDNDAIMLLEVGVDEDHPAPRAEEEAESGPASAELCSHERELLERLQRAPDAFACVGGEAVRSYEVREIGDRGLGEFDARHLQLVERHRLAVAGLLEPELRPLEGPVDPVEQFGDMTSIRVGFVERVGEKRARERTFLDV